MKALAPRNRHLVRRAWSLLLFPVVLGIAAASLHAEGSAVRVETFSLKLNGEVVVENPRGTTRVESWDYQTVRVVAEKTGPAAASAIEPGELVLMGALNSVIVQCKQGPGRIALTLYLPRSARLQITGGVFPVEINGALSSVVVDTTSGSIVYRLPANDDARVSMRSSQGTVKSTVPLADVERIGTHSIQGQLGSGAAQVILNSVAGNVSLTPGPNLTAVAKVSMSQSRASETPQPAPDTTPAGSENTAQPSYQAGGTSQRNQRVASSPDDPDVNTPGGTRQGTQSTGSIDFAGSDRSSDASMTHSSGPLSRPRTERNTSGGNSGLKVRIIPPDASARENPNSNGSVFDKTADDEDDARSAARPSASQSGSGGSGTTSPSNGSMVFGGSDRSADGTMKSRVGPLERDRESRDTSGGNSGLKVRIIPAPGSSRESTSVFNQPEETTNAPAASGNPARNASGATGSRRSDDFDRQAGRQRPIDPDDEVATSSRGNVPPVLQRNRIDDSSTVPVAEPEPRVNGDEEPIVLKAALVNLNVSVTNRSGVALSNLKKEDFEVAENSEPQKIEFFQPTTAPFNLVLALDLSGSIKDKLEIIKSAALRFVDVLGPQDKVAVVTFTDEIRVVSQLTGDRDELKRRIKTVDRSQGGTAFYEAMWFALVDTLRGTRGQRNAIVVLTDGVDSSLDRYNPMQSRVSFNQLSRRLEESDVMVFPIYLDTEYEEVFERGNSSSEAYAIARDQLERIGELSGGQVFRAEKAGDLSGVYKQVAAAIRTVYSVGYYPTNAERDGTFRRVRVVVNKSDAAVRTRKGYYAK